MGLPGIGLSVRQPFAWLIVQGFKDFENRSLGAMRHGMTERRIAIHASKGMTQKEYELARRFAADRGVTIPRPDALVYGAIIGSVDVIGKAKSKAFSIWSVGSGLCLANADHCDPIPSVGQLGYFKWKENGELMTPKPWMVAWEDSDLQKPETSV